MYLHAGKDTVIRCNDIIGVFDIENTSISKITREYLSENKDSQKKKQIITVDDDLPKSFIVAVSKKKRKSGSSKGLGSNKNDKNTSRVYISQISTATLLKRLETGGKNGSALRGELFREYGE